MEVQRSMTREVVTCHEGESLEAATRRMRDRDCGALPVLDGAGRLVGMITDRDICMTALDCRRPLWAIEVREAMSRDVLSLDGRQSVAFAAEMMGEFQLRRLPVVDQERRPRGILSLVDLARLSSCGDVRDGDDVGMDDVAVALARVGEPRPATPRVKARASRVAAVAPSSRRNELAGSHAARHGVSRTPRNAWRLPW